MTPIHESTSARTLGSQREFNQPFAAITAGLVVLLMALAAISYTSGAPAAAPAIGVSAENDAFDGWMPALTAASRQHRLDVAQRIEDGWAAVLVRQPQSTADGWAAVLVPPKADPVDGYIQRFLINE